VEIQGHLILTWATRKQGNWPSWLPSTEVNFQSCMSVIVLVYMTARFTCFPMLTARNAYWPKLGL